jgi:predicted amidohydrolase
MRRLLIAALLFTPCVTLPLQRLTPPEPIALIHGNVVNVRNGQVTPDATVIIRGGRIESIRSAGPAPGGISIIDLNGKYLLPGLIDAHSCIGLCRDAPRAGIGCDHGPQRRSVRVCGHWLS